MYLRIDRKVVPALMFHSVGLENHPWIWTEISESLASFEAKIALLCKRGFNSVAWSELYDHMAGRTVLPDNSILLTFDDGYLDNWVYVYPTLKKYGMKGTVFVTPEFVDPGNQERPNLDDVDADQCSVSDLSIAGFLCWSEMREMERSGVIDIQSHATTHTWYFTGPTIIDFHRPHPVSPYPWLLWNARPDRKPFYLNENQQNFVPWGQPIFEHKKSLIARRFYPDQSAITEITEFVKMEGAQSFFDHPGWSTQLKQKIIDIVGPGDFPGTYESTEDRESRVADELRESKLLIENKLQKEVRFLSWPGGAYDDVGLRIASDIGYESYTLSSRDTPYKRNRPGSGPKSIKRMGSTNNVTVRGRPVGTGGPSFLLLRILAHQGSAFYRLALKIYQIGALVRSLVAKK